LTALHITLKTASDDRVHYIFERGPIYIGRSPSCEVAVPLPWVSVHHLRLIWTNETLSIFDLQARHSCLINGASLERGDEIHLTEPVTITLFSLKIELNLGPIQGDSSSDQDRQRNLLRLWRPESGWLLWWTPTPQIDQNPDSQSPEMRALEAPTRDALISPVGETLFRATQPSHPHINKALNTVDQNRDPSAPRCWPLPMGVRCALSSDEIEEHTIGLPLDLFNLNRSPRLIITSSESGLELRDPSLSEEEVSPLHLIDKRSPPTLRGRTDQTQPLEIPRRPTSLSKMNWGGGVLSISKDESLYGDVNKASRVTRWMRTYPIYFGLTLLSILILASLFSLTVK
jgi:hypothetical protein